MKRALDWRELRGMRAGAVIHGRFEITHIAGSGGMGTVSRAHDTSAGGPVAVKLLRSGPRTRAA